eukprot:TRINITY_DN5853_c0_g1_i1.p1 TRINITY_DN5853_c0_g1~~TRINITY_DN5853_c0_g1_i1.p1  ORF type:complete len:316 (-),score=47.35 TRINITY_DN5853_c0_g1_i1:27-974(-)
MCYLAPIGIVLCWYKRTDANYFLIFYGFISYYFASKMVRLVIIMGPISSALGGIALGYAFDWAIAELTAVYETYVSDDKGKEIPYAKEEKVNTGNIQGKKSQGKNKNRGQKRQNTKKDLNEPTMKPAMEEHMGALGPFLKLYNDPLMIKARPAVAVFAILSMLYCGYNFNMYCFKMSEGMSNPSIMFRAQLKTGETIMVDDYREAYWWLRDNTPLDARVMSWWDYGYQITGIGERTTIADGNTWNHEHIATLGRCLTSPEKRAHKIIRHLADYVLIWVGGGGDDLAKSPHMARIGNSVFSDICPNDPTCRQWPLV